MKPWLFVCLLFLGCAHTTERLPASSSSEWAKEYIAKASRIQKLCQPCADRRGFPVHLTFDDGPSRLTEFFLDTLRRKRVHATFFQLTSTYGITPKEKAQSNWVTAKPEELQRLFSQIKSDGHTIASHTFAHIDHVSTPHDKAMENLKIAFERFPRGTVPLVRLPYGMGWWEMPSRNEDEKRSEEVMNYLKSQGWQQLGWDIDTLDWSRDYRSNQPRALLEDVCTQEGGVILMHDIHPWTAANLETIIDSLECSGHRIVSLREIPTSHTSFQRSAKHVDIDCAAGMSEIKNGKCLVKPGRP
jgi:peptidoglycan/xylan/chitin deacetylase (PgdA/CDA1 family)